jgi:competence protein ComEA
VEPAGGPPPWRVIESPAAGGVSPAPAVTGQGPTSVAGVAVDVRVMATIGATVACAIVAFVLAFGGGSGATSVEGGTLIVAETSPSASGGENGDELIVEIVGAVARPGVYHLASGSRVVDLVEVAGGYGPRVDTARAERELNLAGALKDGDQIRVPSRDDEPAGVASGAPAAGDPGPGDPALVPLNSATSAELEALPGVGPATAAKIIAARDEAPFVVVEDLRTRGILGEKTYDKLKDLVTP